MRRESRGECEADDGRQEGRLHRRGQAPRGLCGHRRSAEHERAANGFCCPSQIDPLEPLQAGLHPSGHLIEDALGPEHDHGDLHVGDECVGKREGPRKGDHADDGEEDPADDRHQGEKGQDGAGQVEHAVFVADGGGLGDEARPGDAEAQVSEREPSGGRREGLQQRPHAEGGRTEPAEQQRQRDDHESDRPEVPDAGGDRVDEEPMPERPGGRDGISHRSLVGRNRN